LSETIGDEVVKNGESLGWEGMERSKRRICPETRPTTSCCVDTETMDVIGESV
jgi:hypothetical protein